MMMMMMMMMMMIMIHTYIHELYLYSNYDTLFNAGGDNSY